MAIAPGAFAHGNTGNHVDGADVLPTPAGYSAGGTTPSGFYYGSASAWLQLNAFSTPLLPANSAPGCPAPTGDADVDGFLCGAFALDPSFTLAFASALCDMEVLGDGAAPFPLDETRVDSTSGGSVPDGLFNDGGVGAVCHTPTGFYGHGAYNTPGCGGSAEAADLVVGGGIWISASCDSTSPVASTPLLTQVLSLETCTVNSVLSGNPGGAATCLTTFTGCVLGVPATCPPTTLVSCGADGVSDATNDGRGDQAGGVPYPAVNSSCNNADGAAATFVWNSVQANLPAPGVPAVTVVSAATTGWVQ